MYMVDVHDLNDLLYLCGHLLRETSPEIEERFHTCDENFGVVCLREGHGVKAGIRRYLTRGETDVPGTGGEGFTPAPRSQEDLLHSLTHCSDEGHFALCV